MSGELLRAALNYAARGWPVFPAYPGTKSPHTLLVAHGVKNATTDPEQITAWWARCPTANVAIATGDPAPDVVDFDVTGGKPGPATYRRLLDAGLLPAPLMVVATPSGGRHLYYAGGDQGNGSLRRHGIDFRSRGGCAIGPPSSVGGTPYTTLQAWTPGEVMVDFNAIRQHLDPPRPTPARPRLVRDGCDELIRFVAAQQEGNRNNGLFWAACKAVKEGADESVFAALVAASTTTGLPEYEARATVASARRGAAA